MITKETKILPVDIKGLPYFLRREPYWTNWRTEFKDGKGKKVPTYGIHKLRGTFWENEGLPFSEAIKTIPKDGGLGLLLTLRNDLACIDIDNCSKDDPRLQRILNIAPDAWCEYSPSGRGIHVWGRLPDKESYLLPGRKIIGYCGKQYEWYATGRSMTVTGHYVCGHSLPDLTQAILYCESLKPKVKYIKHEVIPVSVPVQEILEKAFRKDPELKRMYYEGHNWADKSVEDFYFCRKMWFWLGGHGAATIENTFRQSALYRAHKGNHYPALTVRNAEKRWNGEYYGKNFVNKKE